MTAKVVEFKREGWRDAVSALRKIAEQSESGELPACKVGALVMMGEGGQVDAFGFGPAADDLQTPALFEWASSVWRADTFAGVMIRRGHS